MARWNGIFLLKTIRYEVIKRTTWILFTILLVSCQEGIDDITPIDDDKTITSTAELLDLIDRVTLLDGSSDDILDGSSCFQTLLPVSISVEEIPLTLQDNQAFRDLDSLLSLLEREPDDITFEFPVSIVLPDHSTITLTDEDMFKDYSDECIGDGSDDDIECIDIKYPIKVSVFRRPSETADVLEFFSDRFLNEFIKSLGNEDLLSFEFPIQMIDHLGVERTFNSNSELENYITINQDGCDEKDDFEFEPSFDPDTLTTPLESPLTDGNWYSTLFYDVEELTSELSGYAFSFSEDGSVSATIDGETTGGLWDFNDSMSVLNIEFEGTGFLTSIRKSWDVLKLDSTIVVLQHISGGTGSSEFLVFERDIGNMNTQLEIIMSTGNWGISEYLDDGKDETDRFSLPDIDFNIVGAVEIYDQNDTLSGNWLSVADLILLLHFDESPYNELSNEWTILEFNENVIRLEVESGSEVDHLTITKN